MSSASIVSVIIIFLNAADFIREAIDSVLSQTYKNWELLLVDDGSTDGSTGIALSYAAQQPGRIFYLEHEGHQNLGMSTSRNLGIKIAKGHYIAFLDADDYWLPNRLEAHVRMLDDHPAVGMLFGSTKYWFSWTEKPEDKQRDYVPFLRVRENTLFNPPDLLPLFLEGRTEIPSPCSILLRRDAVEKIGGFEDAFRGMYEDQAFYTKMSLSEKVLAVDDCLSWYRQHPNSHVSIVAQSDQSLTLHFSFLKWVESFCQSKGVVDKRVLLAIRRQLWLYNSKPSSFLRGTSLNRVRWIKKWVLRMEEHLLPFKVRNWLWIRSTS